MRYLDLLVDSITRLDPQFIEAYHFASLVYWSDFGDVDESHRHPAPGHPAQPGHGLAAVPGGLHALRVGARLPPGGPLVRDGRRAAATPPTARRRFAAFARYRAGDDRVSLALWEDLLQTSQSPQMQELAEKMIRKLQRKLELRELYGPDFVGPIPEV